MFLSGTGVLPVHGDPILAQYPFSAVNAHSAVTPACGGNPPGPSCPGAGGQTYGTCFQPNLTGAIGSASLMMDINQVANGIPRRGQPVISGRILILAPANGITYGTTCRAANPYSTAAVQVAQSNSISFCYSGGGCFCGNCVGLGSNFQVVTWAFDASQQAILAAGQTYVFVLYLFCDNAISCVFDDNNSFDIGTDSTSGYAGGAVSCRACMVVDPWNTGPFARSQFDDTIAIGRGLSVPFVVYGTSGGVTPPPSSCQGGNCGAVVNTNSTSNLNWNSSLTLFYIGTSPFNGYIINATTYLGKTYIGTLYLGIYVVNQGCITAAGPFSVQCPGILMSSTSFSNPNGPQKMVMLTSVQVSTGQVFGVAVSGSQNGLVINDTNTGSVMYKTTGTIPTVISQFSILSSTSKVALFAGLFQGLNPPSISGSGGANSVGDAIIGLVDWFGMGRLAGGLLALLIFFIIFVGVIAFSTAHLNRSPGGSPRPGFPPVGFLLIFLFLVFIFSAPIGTGGVSVLPPWVTIFVMAVFAWLFTEGILKRGGRF